MIKQDDRLNVIKENILFEEDALSEIVGLARSGLAPETWSDPFRQIFAQAALPVLRERQGLLPVPRLEHAKGLRMLLRIYPGRITFESLPSWIVQAARGDRREPELERAAERVRHNLTRGLEISNDQQALEQR